MDPDVFSAWQTILRDLVVVVLGAFMLVYETIFITNPNAYIVGAGLTLLGVPPALRLDRKRRHKDDDEG